jgi:Alpha galactosidase A/Alpha galactosidase C-terminal beta sandwich domain
VDDEEGGGEDDLGNKDGNAPGAATGGGNPGGGGRGGSVAPEETDERQGVRQGEEDAAQEQVGGEKLDGDVVAEVVEDDVGRFADVVPWIPYAGPGGWNDLDSLELGNGDKDGITPAERQSMFILWTISCAPLYLGSDLTHLDPADLTLISNRELIAVDQAGIPARPLDLQSLHTGGRQRQAWLTQYPDGSAVLALFNLGKDDADFSLSWREVDALRDTHFADGAPPVLRDLISGASVASAGDNLKLHIASHNSRIFRIAPADKRSPS